MKKGKNAIFTILALLAVFAALFASCDLFGTDEWEVEDDISYSNDPNTYNSSYKSTVVYNANGGEGKMADQVFSYGKAQKLRPNAFTREGYDFGGWTEWGPDWPTAQYANGQSVTYYPYYDETITMYAIWQFKPYTVVYNANGGEGAVEKSTFDYRGGYLAPNAFTRAGYDFAGWSLSPDGAREYENQQKVVTLPGSEKGTVTLYAVWSVIACTIVYNANGGEGEMADTWLMVDDTSPFLRGNSFVRTGYAFEGWAESADGSVTYFDWHNVHELTATAGKKITLYAVWRARTYTIAYNANGGDGAMASSTFLIDVPQKLSPNTFTRENSVFAGWATYYPTNPVKYTDEQSVINVGGLYDYYPPEEGETVTLYAVWINRYPYTVAYHANGGEGTMADSAFISGEAQNLRNNAFTRTGYAFAGWATSNNGNVEYNNQQSYTYSANTAGEIRHLYAVWRGNSYTVAYNGNGSSGGSTANSTHTYGTPSNLRSNGFTRTGHAFAGWALTYDGPVEFSNGQSVSNLTETNNGTVNLFAVWSPYTYTVAYDKNANAAFGTMSSQPFTYGVAQNLYTNSFNRVGYDFAGWARTSAGAVEFSNGQSVINLNSTNNETVTLYAKWTLRSDSAYTVVFYGNGSTGGSMGSQSFVYDTAQQLTANAFTRAGYTFLGWSKSDTATTATYANGQSVTNLTATMGETVPLYAVWKANTFAVKYNGNGNTSGSMGDTAFTSGVEQALSRNNYIRTNYTFAGWATSDSRADAYTVDYTNEQRVVFNADAAVTLYAVWYHNYAVDFDSNGGGYTYTYTQSFVYGTAQNLMANTFVRAGYTFAGWARTSAATTADFTDKQSFSDPTATAGATITLYAVWNANTYTVAYDKNATAADGNMGSQSFTYGVSKALSKNTFTRPNYRFTGWSINPSATSPTYADQESVSALTTTANETVTLRAVWSNTYTVKYDKNTTAATTGSTANSTHTYGVAKALTNNGFTRTGYAFMGWATSANGAKAYDNGQSVTDLATTAQAETTLYAKWTHTYTVTYNANGGSANGGMAAQTFTYGVSQALTANRFGAPNYHVFAGWALTADGPVKYANGEVVNNLSMTPGETVPLYAKWRGIEYTVRYNANDANDAVGTMGDQLFTYGVAQALTKNKFTRPSHRFNGWARTATGTVEFTDEQSVINLSTTNNGTVPLYAKWTNSYTVKYNANGGSGSMSDQNFTDGVAQNLRLNNGYITKLGHTFIGWATSDNGAKVYDDGQSVNNLATAAETAVTLYAVWSVNSYTVVFNANGDNVTGSMNDQTFTFGVSQNLRSNAFNRTNYTFAGWATSSDATTVQYTNGQNGGNMATAAGATVTLYAVWRNNYTVRYNGNGSTDGSMADQPFVYGTAQNLRANTFAKTNSVFQGWATTLNGAKVYDDGQSVTDLTTAAGAEVPLYAVWASYYTIKYNANGGEGTMADSLGELGQSVSLRANAFTRANYRFLGWSTNSNATSPTYTAGQSVNMTSTSGGTLYAIWSNTYTVTYNANATTGVTGTVADQVFTIGNSQALRSNGFTRTNYTFAGWSTNPNATSPTYTAGQTVSNLTTTAATYTLYAVWQNNYTVIFNGNDNTGGSMSNQIIYGSGQFNANNFTRTNYAFAGWSTNKGATSATYADRATAPTNLAAAGGTVTLYAVWVSPHTVIYNGNGYTGGGPMTNSSFAVGTSQTLSQNTFTRTGCVFIGWATSQVTLNDGTVAYADRASFTASGGQTTLYAVWRTTYTVSFATSSTSDGTMAVQNFVYGTAQNLNTNTYNRAGSTFQGWATTAGNATLGTVTYSNRANVNNLTETPGGTVTLYAVWR